MYKDVFTKACAEFIEVMNHAETCEVGMIVVLITLFAVTVQAASGFGLSLVSMPLLVGLIGIRTATPLVSMIGLTAELVLLFRYRHALNFTAIKQLSLASIFGIPLGVYVLRQVDAAIITPVLGILITSYALYALTSPRLPKLQQVGWAYGFGFLGGVLGGAYNTSGPPIIIYGTCRRWEPASFKGNLQAYFLLKSVLTLATHTISGNFTAVVWRNYLWALPAIALGLFVGNLLDKRINPNRFRKAIFLLLIILGIRLIVG